MDMARYKQYELQLRPGDALAVNNTRVATMLSIPETLIFPNLTMLTLPFLLGADGVWWCFPATQLLTFLITAAFAVRSRDLYGYGKSGIATALEN